MDPQLYAAKVIRAALPDATVDTLIDGVNAISSAAYIWVADGGGAATRPGQLETPLIQLATYSNVSRSAASSLAQSAQKAIFDAWRNQTVIPDCGHLTFLSVVQRPTLSPVDGLPGGVHRYFAIYSVGLRP